MKNSARVAAAALLQAAHVSAHPPAYGNATTSAAVNSSITFVNPTGVSTTYSTKSFDPSLASTQLPNDDFSNERLAFLWNQVGPIATGPVTTTVSPTPEPTAYGNPSNGLHPYVPSYVGNLSGEHLPSDFIWGVASSAYQIEGAAKDEGKGPSIWDFLSHRVAKQVADNTTGDVVASHYYLYKQDIARMKAVGIPEFGFSISWPRIFPFGSGPINPEGVAHYDDVFAELVKNGIKPSPVLFHWDTPLELFNSYGAWSDKQIVDDFFNYVVFIIQRYDHLVDTWFTINEPQYCNWQYSYYPFGTYLPLYNNVTQGIKARFTCGHYTLLAHAKVAKWYHEEFKGRGKIRFKNSGNYFEANSTAPADAVSVQRNYDFVLGWFNYPVWGPTGDYPQTLRDTLGDILPTFTQAEKDIVKGSCDFFAIDPYTGYYAFGIPDLEACTSNSSYPGYPECAGSASTAPDGFPIGPSADPAVSWLYSTPVGLRKFLNAIKKTLFPTVPSIMVTEFGFAEPFESQMPNLNAALWDLRRADYYQGYLDSMLAAVVEDDIPVSGALGWAIFDNFEWGSGTNVRFGMQYLNYTDLTRTPKASLFTFVNWFKDHGPDLANTMAGVKQDEHRHIGSDDNDKSDTQALRNALCSGMPSNPPKLTAVKISGALLTPGTSTASSRMLTIESLSQSSPDRKKRSRPNLTPIATTDAPPRPVTVTGLELGRFSHGSQPTFAPRGSTE
nr:hypothetical protein B0A51_07745 [Rachicladosporium sp. CCFEE 5018]